MPYQFRVPFLPVRQVDVDFDVAFLDVDVADFEF